MRNLTLAFRTLARTPFVTAVAILSLALGIGANAAIFSLFEQMLLRPLPVAEPGRLVNLAAPGPKPGSQSCNQAGDCDVVFSYPMFRDLERAETPLSEIAAHRIFSANLAFGGETLNGEGVLVSGSYFPVLGVRPALGRLLGPDDDRTPGAHFVAVLSFDHWQTYMGGDPDVVGRTITINGHPMTIIGVAPRGFEGTTFGSRPRVFVPLSMRAQVEPGFDDFDNRRSYWAYVFGRLKPGVSIDRAAAGLNAVYRPIVDNVEAPLQEGMSDETMARFRTKELQVEPGMRGQSSALEDARTPMLLLFGMTGVVLLIACANIANLLLARGAGRSMEMAVRLSLGARRGQVLAQLLTESLVLAVLGGLASLLVARGTLALISSILGPDASGLPVLELRPVVVAFTGAVAIGTGILFGIFPALHSTRPDLVTTIRANAGSITGARTAARFRGSLVTAQIALSMALLVAAGLFVRSLVNISRVELGIDPERVVTFRVSPELNGYEPERSRALFERAEDELAAVPGVTSVSAALVPVLSGSNWGTDVAVEGFESGPDIDSNSRLNEVGPGFFSTLGISFLSGRDFTRADAAGREKVAVVNEAFTRKFRLGRDAVGRFMSANGSDSLDVEIVGVVEDARYSEVKDEVPPVFFTPYRQDERVGAIAFYVRTAADPDQVMQRIPRIISGLDPNLPVEELKSLPQQVRENISADRLITTLSAAFAALATLLAAIGLYGVLAYTVAQRTREIGVRMALGADAARVRRMVLRQVGWMMLIGGVIGLAGALGLGRAAGSLLYQMQGNDPAVLALAAGLLTAVSLGAGYLPALRASRVNPMEALRAE